jgi:hypothetical protein
VGNSNRLPLLNSSSSQGNQLEGEGLAAISSAMAGNTKLESLDLSDNRINGVLLCSGIPDDKCMSLFEYIA